jgi:hypothetical protein
MKNIVLSLLILVSFTSQSQIVTPQPSPLSSVEQKVGLTDFKVVYSRPSKKERTIFGELVPFDKMWRTGANASTKLSFNTDVKINGTPVNKGEYALYTIPGKTEWTIIIHRNLTYWGTGGDKYNPEEDVIRFKVKPNAYAATIETFTINFAHVTNTSTHLELLWENTQVNIPISVSYDEEVMASIEKSMTISKGTYYTAARYYLENDKDTEQALTWINKALENNEKYWYMRQKALILAKLSRYKEAVDAAKRSMELAEEAGNQGYVDMNLKSIADWKKR